MADVEVKIKEIGNEKTINVHKEIGNEKTINVHDVKIEEIDNEKTINVHDVKIEEIDNEETINANDVKSEEITYNSSSDVENPAPKLSKNQMKKQKKQQWIQENKLLKRQQERENRKEKRKALFEAGLPMPKRTRPNKRCPVELSKLKIIIDVDFVDLMNENDLRMVLNQVKYCYSKNRKQTNPCHLAVTSFQGKIKDVFAEVQPGYINWMNISFEENSYLHKRNKDNLVYLTADSENVLTEINENDTYIIGGLVDHNQHKNICYERANLKGLRHAKFPIDNFIRMQTRKVLTINHVFEILLEFYDSNDWESSFFKIIPKRKKLDVKNPSETTEELFSDIPL